MRLIETGLVLLLLCGNASGQWTAVSAKVKETTVTSKAGAVVETKVRSGHFYRSSDGSRLYLWLDSEGLPRSGDLLQNQEPAMYTVNYVAKQAVRNRKLERPLKAENVPVVKDFGLGEDMVSGVPCRYAPVFEHPGPKQIGKVCTDTTGLNLRREITRVLGEFTVRILMEKSDVQLGAEPPAALFSVAGLTVYTPSAPE
jgi:hypothetical protein